MNGGHRALPREVLQIPPLQPAGLRHAGARVIQELQQGLVALALGRGRPGRMEQIQSIPFRENPFRQPIRLRQGPDRRPHIELQVAGTLPESQQTAHGGQVPIDTTGGLALMQEVIPPLLQVRQGQPLQRRLAGPGEAAGHVAGVGGAGVGRCAAGQPQGNQVQVVARARPIRERAGSVSGGIR